MKKRKITEKPDTDQTTCIFVFSELPLVFPLLLSYPVNIIQQLKRLSVADISLQIAKQNQLAGRLKLFKNNWEKACSDRWVLNAIQCYSIERATKPYQDRQPVCPHFSGEERDSLEIEIAQMRQKGAISLVEENRKEGFLSTFFLVPKKECGHRPIINLKRLNQFIPHHHFKVEGIHMLKDLLRKGDWMAKIDLKDAYFAVPISEPDKKYLRFRWDQEVYQFNCLPFGLSCAPWVFTKIIEAATAVLREMGIRLIIYIDDMLIMAESETLLKDHVAGTVYLLENLGFVINLPKSILEPQRTIDFLGFQVDSSTMELKLPGNKMEER